MIQYRKLEAAEINRALFKDFIRHQIVTKCWRRQAGELIMKDSPFIDDWSEEDRQTLTDCFKKKLSLKTALYMVLLAMAA